jgi:HD superfamily phosphohydrolase YqeK
VTIDIDKTRNTITELLYETNREGVCDFINWLDSTDFFIAPASTRYHLNVKGGLAHHSLSVCKTLSVLSDVFAIPILPDTITITGLLHDVCKINIYHKDTNSEEKEYFRDDTFPIGHGEKSVILITNHGLRLTNTEMLMIRWHMAMYDSAYPRAQKYVNKYCPEAKLLYFADDISSTYMED